MNINKFSRVQARILTITGPNRKHRPLACCHWNVNSLTTHRMLKKSSIEVYNTNHKYDFICISETCLDSTVAADEKDLVIEGYNLAHADHSSNAVQLINVN